MPAGSPHPPHARLAPRERQIMDVIYRRGQATAEEVRADLPDAVSNSAVRGMLRLLEEKGYLRHEQHGLRYVYLAAGDTTQVRRSAVASLVHTFFDNSAAAAAVAMLGLYESKLSDADLDRLEDAITQARARGSRRAGASTKRTRRTKEDV